MTIDPQVVELLARWQEARDAGQPLSVEELCADSPKLISAVTEELRRLQELRVFQSDPTAPPGPPPAPATPPGYEILDELGRGGMGVVYKARQKDLGRVVALKMILAGSHASPEQRLRFQFEAEAIARVRHQGIVEIHDFGEVGGLPFFSMEFCDGGSLAELLKSSRFTPDQAAGLVEALARAVQHAHALGVLHRDLKPGNVLLTGEGTPKITDFGLARRLDAADGPTRTGTPLGTLAYMAPEQASGQTSLHGPGMDIHALGVILYELLTSRAPYRADSLGGMFQLILEAPPESPRRLRPETPRDLEVICLKCLNKEPGKRYASAGEMANDLRRFLDGEPIHARPIGRAERAWMWARRRPVVAGLMVALLLVVAGGGAGVTAALLYAMAGWRQATYNEEQANANAFKAQKAEQDTRKQLEKNETLQHQTGIAFAQEFLRRRLYRRAEDALKQIPLSRKHWECHYLDRQCDRAPMAVRRLAGHDWGVAAGCLSPNGRQLATSGHDGRVLLWDVADDRLQVVAQRGVWSPRLRLWRHTQIQAHDEAEIPPSECFPGLAWCGEELLGAGFSGQKGRAVRWTIRPGSVSRRDLLDNEAPLFCVAVSPGGDAVFGGKDGSLIGVSISGKQQGRLRLSERAVLTVLALPSGQWLAGQEDGMLSLVSPRLEGIVRRERVCQGPVWDLALSPEGNELVVACELPKLLAYRVEPGEPFPRRDDSYLVPDSESEASLALHAAHISTSGLVLAGDDRGRLLVWKRGEVRALHQPDSGAAQHVKEPMRGGLPLPLRRKLPLLASTRDGQGLYTGGMDPVIRRWWLKASQRHPAWKEDAPPLCLLFDHGQPSYLWVGDGKGQLRVYEAGEEHPLRATQPAHHGAICALAGSRTGLMASVGEDGQVRFWRRQGQKLEALGRPLKVGTGLLGVSLDDQARRLCIYDDKDRVWLYELPSQKILGRRTLRESGMAPAARGLAVLSPDGSKVAVAGPGQMFLVLSALGLTTDFDGSTAVLAGDGGVGLRWRRGHPATLITGDSIGRVKELVGQKPFSLPRPSGGLPLRGLALTADGARLAMLGNDGSLDLVDVEQRHLLLTLPPVQRQEGHDLAFSPCGRWLAVADAHGGIVCYEAWAPSRSSPPPPTIDPRWRERRLYPGPEERVSINVQEDMRTCVARDRAGRVWVLFHGTGSTPEAEKLKARETFLGRETAGGFEVEPLGLSDHNVTSMALLADGDEMVAAVRRKEGPNQGWTELLRRHARTGQPVAGLAPQLRAGDHAGFSLTLFRHGGDLLAFYFCYGTRSLGCTSLQAGREKTISVGRRGDGEGLEGTQGPDGRLHFLHGRCRYDGEKHPPVYLQLRAGTPLQVSDHDVVDPGCQDRCYLATTPRGTAVVLYRQLDARGQDRYILAYRDTNRWRPQPVPPDMLPTSRNAFSLRCPAEDEVLLTAEGPSPSAAYLLRCKAGKWSREPVWRSPVGRRNCAFLLPGTDGELVILIHESGPDGSALYLVRRELD